MNSETLKEEHPSLNQGKLVITIVIAVLTGALGFFIGSKYSHAQATKTNARVSGRQIYANFGSGVGTGNPNSIFVTGQVLTKDDQSVAVALPGGGSYLIFYSTNTPVTLATATSISSLEVGQRITAIGARNLDGAMMAQNIQINSATNSTTTAGVGKKI